jgi:16S rRNA A1518/A1519 N6-dimethyltransferase RsmA/KsgA/DIM1 with predicted DNA glycosylase/AP lyase activity
MKKMDTQSPTPSIRSPVMAIKKHSEKILEEITEKFMEKILDMANQNVKKKCTQEISRHQKSRT